VKVRIYKTIILSAVIYGCETWSLTLRQEHRLRVEKPHNEELHDLYSSPSIIRIIKSKRMRFAEHVARMGGKARGKETTKQSKT
jgi:hypothetical protein